MVEESIYVRGREVQAIQHAAKNAGVVVSVGISERHKTATLFNSNLVINAGGEINVHHRKLVPTFFEKLTWSPGDGYGLRLTVTPFGKIGALICGENTNPLARYALMALGEQVHISTWPAVWPTKRSKSEEGKESGPSPENYDNVAANRMRSAAHCFEAKCFGISCAGHFSTDNMDEILRISGDASCLSTLQQTPRAATMFMGPTGSLLPSFTVNEHTGAVKMKEMIQDEEDILYAEIDLADCVEGKQYHDVAGGYQRFDVFNFRIDRGRRSATIMAEKPNEIPDEEERFAPESAAMFPPDRGGVSFRVGSFRPLGPSLRSRNSKTPPVDMDAALHAASQEMERKRSSPTGFRETDSSSDQAVPRAREIESLFDQAQLSKGTKKQKEMSDGTLGAGSKSTPLKIRHISANARMQSRYNFQPKEGDYETHR